jgi:carbonic anhydrase
MKDLQSQGLNSQDANSHNIQFHYGTLGLTPSLKQMELHRRLQISAPAGNTLDFDQNRYQLVQFHVHSPSEHQIHHHSAAAELHFVHRNDQGQTLVVAVLLEPGSKNPVFESLLNVSPTDPAINSDKVLETALDTSAKLSSKFFIP